MGHHSSNRQPSWFMRLLFAPLGLVLLLMAMMPFSVLYPIASFIGFLAYRIVRYRRRIVHINILESFPEMSASERARIERKFYRHLADYFVETVKFSHMSEKSLRRHMQFADTFNIDNAIAEGRDIVIYTSHFGNWEWITSMGLWCESSSEACFSHVYRPLRQPWFDRWFLRLRSRFNVSIPMKEVFRRLLTWRREDKRWVTGFLSDQKPSHAGKIFPVPFLGRETPFIGGTEELACKLDAVVMYFDTEVMGRGRYRSTIRVISRNPRAEYPGRITQRYAESLETQIRRCPQAYLWSHNRWRIPKASSSHK